MTVESRGTEANLLEQFRSQPVRIGEELYRSHVDVALRVARREISDPQDAEDAVAEAFTRILSMMARGKGPERSFRSYLLRTVRSVLRERRRHPDAMESEDLEQLLPTETTEHTVARREESRIVLAAYAELPERWRDVLWRLDVEGNPPRVVGEQLGMSANAVSALAVRAREGLKENFLARSSLRKPLPECEEYVPMLATYVRGRLTAGRTRRLRAHLKDCSRCNAAYLALVETSELMRAEVFPVLVVAAGFGMRLSGISPAAWDQLVSPLGEPFLRGTGGALGGPAGNFSDPAGSAAHPGDGGAPGPGGSSSGSGAGALGGAGHLTRTLVGVGASVLLCLALAWGVFFHAADPDQGHDEASTAEKAPQIEVLDPTLQQQDAVVRASDDSTARNGGNRAGLGAGGSIPGAGASDATAAPADARLEQPDGNQSSAADANRGATTQAGAASGSAASGSGGDSSPSAARDSSGSTASHAPRSVSSGAADGTPPEGTSVSPRPAASSEPTADPEPTEAPLPTTAQPTPSARPTVAPTPTGGESSATSSAQPTTDPSPTPHPTGATGLPSPDPTADPTPEPFSSGTPDVDPTDDPGEGDPHSGTTVIRYCWDDDHQGGVHLCQCVWTTAQGEDAPGWWECVPYDEGGNHDETGADDGAGTAEGPDTTVHGTESQNGSGLPSEEEGDRSGEHEPEAAEAWTHPLVW